MKKEFVFDVCPLPSSELPQALALVERVFLAFEAPEYSTEGIQTFLSFLRDAEAVSALRFYGAWEKDSLLGVLATRGGSHIALFFVDAAHQGQGVGRALFEAARAACSVGRMTVNSSPYAVEIYRKLGFSPLSDEQGRDGIRFTPMQYSFGKGVPL